MIDIRTWTLTQGTEEMVPTAKGVSVNVSLLPDLKKALERGYGRFINDTYWFLMPAKMLDPGVSLASQGESALLGKAYSVVRLTFAGVGLTPRETPLMSLAPKPCLRAFEPQKLPPP